MLFPRRFGGRLLLLVAMGLAGCAPAGDHPATGRAGNQAGHPALASTTPGQVEEPLEGFRHGYPRALAAGRPMLLVFTVEGCPHCQRLLRQMQARSEVGQPGAKLTVIQVSAEQEPEVCRQFSVRAWPTLEFLSAQGVPLGRMVGCPRPGELAERLRGLESNLAARPWPSGGRLRR